MKLLWLFYLFSFLGLCMERVYARMVGRDHFPRRCRLVLPLCPVYGLGALVIVCLPEPVRAAPPLLFLVGGAAATAVEYLCAVFYERVWRVRFWSYTGLPGNVRGRICLPFSVIWGLLSLGLVYLLEPGMSALAALLPGPALTALSALFVSDTAVTAVLLRRRGTARQLCAPPVPQAAENLSAR